MPFSHHSHSGQFCGHATDTLEEVVRAAIARRFRVLALTEHMPRYDVADLYPGEEETPESLQLLFDRYYAEATRLRDKYRFQIQLLIGFETEWISPQGPSSSSFEEGMPSSAQQQERVVSALRDRYAFDMFVGSIHHVHGVPIDFDRALYEKARRLAGGTDEALFERYFDEQYDMLRALRPPVVGHLDVIRLKSDDPNGGFRRWEGAWRRAVRNVELVVGYGGVFEVNSAALRKGMDEPYPCAEILHEVMRLGGRLALSDDSHGLDQIGTNYHRLLEFLRKVGVREVVYLQPMSPVDHRPGDKLQISNVTLAELESEPFWTAATSKS